MTSCRPVSVRASLSAVSLASEPLSPSRTRSSPAGAIADERLLERDARLAHRRGRDVAEPPDLVADGGHDRGMGSGRWWPRRSCRRGRRSDCRPGRSASSRSRVSTTSGGSSAAGPRPGALDRAHPLDDPGAPADPGRAARPTGPAARCIGRGRAVAGSPVAVTPAARRRAARRRRPGRRRTRSSAT